MSRVGIAKFPGSGPEGLISELISGGVESAATDDGGLCRGHFFASSESSGTSVTFLYRCARCSQNTRQGRGEGTKYRGGTGSEGLTSRLLPRNDIASQL